MPKRDFYTTRTVQWEEGRVILIDQTRLPSRLTYIECTDATQVANAIRAMVVRGAPAIGVAAAAGLALTAAKSEAADRDDLIRELEAGASMMVKTRPTAVNIAWAMERVLKRVRDSRGKVEELRSIVVEEAKSMADEDVDMNRRMGMRGEGLLSDGDVVLTHCKW